MTLFVGDECYINGSSAYPELAGAKCKVIGDLELRQQYNQMGHFIGVRLSYLIEVNGQQICAPPVFLREKTRRSDWCALKAEWYGETQQIWQPRREAR